MKAITLRNIPPALAQIIQGRAEKERWSISRTVIKLLEEAAGLQPRMKERRVHHDLDSLSGCWTSEEARAFEEALARQRRIDPRLWAR